MRKICDAILWIVILLGCAFCIWAASGIPLQAQSSGPNPPPPPVCNQSTSGNLYTDTTTQTVYSCNYYNLAWQWQIVPVNGGLLSQPTAPGTCAGPLPVYVTNWPNTTVQVCVNGIPTTIQGAPGPAGPPGPAGTFNWRGSWTANTAYAKNDAYIYSGTSYAVITAYTSGATFGTLDTNNSSEIATGLPLTGGTLTGPLYGTSASFSGSVSPATVQPSSTPTLDIRNPAFAGGAVCNDSTDIGPALQAAVNALPAAGGNIQIVSSPTACYWANPNTITWPSLTGAINLYINGTLDLGTSFVTPANDLMNIYCMGGSGESQFVPGGSTCTMKLNTTAGAPTGTLGTAVSTTPGTAATVTFTPSTMHGLSAGTGISVADSVSCTISSATVSSGKVTVTLSAACHIPPGVPVTVAGSSNSTFNCAYAGGSYPQQCLATASDYGLNTITYNDSSASGTSSGGTITGLNEDSPENVLISSCTTSTCTATFYRPHTAQAVWGVDTLVIGGSTHPMQIVGLGLSNYWGTSLWMDGGYGSRIDGVGITNTGQCSGTYSAFDADVETSFVHFDHDAFLYGCSPWALRFSQPNSEPGAGTGYMHIDNSFVAGIKVDHGAEGIYVHNLVAEQTPRGIISFDPNYYAWTGSGSVPQFSLDGVGFQDNSNGFPQTLLYYLSSPSTATSASSAASGYARITNSRQTQAKYVVNDYFQGGLYDDGSNIGYGINTQPGVVGIHDDGITFDGEIRGEGASMGLSAVPYQTATILPVSSWTGSCTNTTGALDPQGGTGAVALSWTTNSVCYSTVSNYTYTPAAGDTVIFGGWVKTTTPGAGAQAGNGTDFQVSNNASSHFTWAGTTYSTVGSGAYDSNLSGDWWHPVVGIATVATSDGTANQRISLQLTGNSTEVIDYFAPFMIVIPASANVPLAEINRYRTQLLHGCVPSNYNGVGIPATCDAVASAGYYLLNPAGGSPNVIIPGTATLPYVGFKTYSGTGSPTDTCASTANTGAIEINATPTAYQCSNATGSYAWNGLGGGGTYTGSSPIVVTGTVISCPTCGTSTGTSVQVNGGSTLGTANLANSSGAGEIDFANPSGSTVNATVHNPTISGVSLGSNLNTLTFGTHLTGTSYNGSAGVTLGTDATSANTASTIVARDGSENFSAGTITAALNGNASSATTAGNVTATSNTTLTSLTNLAGVGTIGTGTWQGTAIAPAYGGTGQNESSATGVGHWSSGVYSVSTTLPSGLSAANMSLTTPALGTPASGVITNLTGTCTSCSVGGNATTATGISTSGTANQVWGMNAGGTAQGWQSVASGGGNVSTSGTVTTGYIPKWASATTVTNSGLDDGVTEGVGGLTYTYSAGPVFTLNNTAATGSTDECFEGVDAENSSSSGNYGELCFNSGYGAHFYLQHQPTAALTTGYTFMDANSNLLALLDAFNGNFYVRGGLGVGSSAIIIIPSTATLPYVGFKTYSGSGTPTDTCSATANTGAIEINATPTAYQCSNATGSYAWNSIGSGSGTMSDGSGTTTAGYFASTTTTAHTYSVDTNLDDGKTTANTLSYSGSGGIASTASGTGTLSLTNSHAVSIAPDSQSAAYTLSIPALSGNDTMATLGLAQTFSGTNTFSGGIVNTRTPIRDQTVQVLAANMTAASGTVGLGSTGSGNTTFSWPVTSANWYKMECSMPVTFVSSATIEFALYSISGGVTISDANGDMWGNLAASAAVGFYSNYGVTTIGSTLVGPSGAPGAVTEMLELKAEFLTSNAGNIGLEFIGNGTNNVQPLEGGMCTLTQVN